MKDFNATRVELLIDSLLVVSQIKEEYDANDSILQSYLAMVRELLKLLDHADIKHVPCGENAKDGVLSKFANMKIPRNLRSVIQETLSKPSVSLEVWITRVICVINVGQGMCLVIFGHRGDTLPKRFLHLIAKVCREYWDQLHNGRDSRGNLRPTPRQ